MKPSSGKQIQKIKRFPWQYQNHPGQQVEQAMQKRHSEKGETMARCFSSPKLGGKKSKIQRHASALGKKKLNNERLVPNASGETLEVLSMP